MARLLRAEDKTVVLGAADTFRAAASEQLATWGSRVGVPVVASDREGGDGFCCVRGCEELALIPKPT